MGRVVGQVVVIQEGGKEAEEVEREFKMVAELRLRLPGGDPRGIRVLCLEFRGRR